MKISLLLTLLFFVLLPHARGQSPEVFRGVLINTLDSAYIPYAVITLENTGKTMIADSAGGFSFIVPKDNKTLVFRISVMGRRSVIHHSRTFNDTEKVYLEVLPLYLKEAEITGLSARDIVRKAVNAIPDNYADSSYFAYSSYRQYQQIDNAFANLVEATPVVMFRLSKEKKHITSKEAFALRQVRRTRFVRDHMNKQRDDASFLMTYNPVYYLSKSSLSLNKLYSYRFSYDTIPDSVNYVIHYLCPKYSTEDFGFAGFDINRFFPGCIYETGTIVIDRKTFAIRHVARKTVRNPGYSFYQSQINFIYPAKKYFYEFNNAELVADYEEHNGKWYLKMLNRRYCTDFFISDFGTKDCSITDVFEWRCDSISRYITADLLQSFYPKLLEYRPYTYNKAYWDSQEFPFYFYDRETVMKGLEVMGNVERQFYKEGLEEPE